MDLNFVMSAKEFIQVNTTINTRLDSDAEQFDHIDLSNDFLFSEFDDESEESPLLDDSLSFNHSVVNNDGEIREKFGDCPLHRNAPISTAGSLLIILSFANRNKITGKALSGFKLISLHCPVEYHYADFP